MIGRTAICGKLGNDKTQYTYGTYIDDTAEELEYVNLSSGRFPEKTRRQCTIMCWRICFYC